MRRPILENYYAENTITIADSVVGLAIVSVAIAAAAAAAVDDALLLMTAQKEEERKSHLCS